MLVTPVLPNDNDIAGWRTRLREQGILNWEYNPPQVLQEGVIIGGLNMSHDLKARNKFDDYPVFHYDEYMIRSYTEDKDKDHPNPHYRKHAEKELAKYLAVPENVKELYRRELWKAVWDRSFQYDTPEEREQKIAEHPEHYAFENYEPYLGPYGVVDSPEQLLAMYDFEADPRRFFIRFTPIHKKNQPSWGGWHWHKWGDYLGNHNPQHEYLYDEEGIEVVYVFHIYELKETK